MSGRAIVTVSMTVEAREYADGVAARERAARGRFVSRSEVVGWALTLLKYFRHDADGPLNHLNLVAEQLRRGQLTRDEAAAEILRTTADLERRRRDAAAAVPKAPAGL